MGNRRAPFLYVDECVEATRRLMDSEFTGPVNIGSEECITINELAARVIHISGKSLKINNILGPGDRALGAYVRGGFLRHVRVRRPLMRLPACLDAQIRIFWH